jgi:hypothetical protein
VRNGGDSLRALEAFVGEWRILAAFEEPAVDSPLDFS